MSGHHTISVSDAIQDDAKETASGPNSQRSISFW